MSFELSFKNYIDGKWRGAEASQTFEVRNPADLRQVCHAYPRSTPADATAAVEAAGKAFPEWRRVPLAKKVAILRKAAWLIRAEQARLAELITLENGKLLSESRTEVEAAALELEFQIGEGERQFGKAGDCYRSDLWAYSRKEPLGVVSVITPWNFPFNVPFRKLGPALLAGNTAVFKPASQTPAVGEAVVRILLEAGLPEGVLQFVTGSGGALSESLVAHPSVRAVTFTGSTEVGRGIAALAAKSFTRTQLEMGGKNPTVVLADADLDLAAQEVFTGAFSCAGQWCTATSRLVVEEAAADGMVERLLARIGSVRLGPGNSETSTMGPVAGQNQLTTVLGHIERAREQGARFVSGGHRAIDGNLQHGCFVAPTIVDHVGNHLDIASVEVFGPVLAIIRVQDYDNALQVANAVPYGLSSSIFTRDLAKAHHFAEHTEVGLTHINMHSAYKEPQQSFGGVKESGFGLPEAGSAGIQFFQEEKAIYVRRGW